MDTSKVNRVEVINHSKTSKNTGRVYVTGEMYGEKIKNVELSLQDDNRTLKIFII